MTFDEQKKNEFLFSKLNRKLISKTILTICFRIYLNYDFAVIKINRYKQKLFIH